MTKIKKVKLFPLDENTICVNCGTPRSEHTAILEFCPDNKSIPFNFREMMEGVEEEVDFESEDNADTALRKVISSLQERCKIQQELIEKMKEVISIQKPLLIAINRDGLLSKLESEIITLQEQLNQLQK